MKWPRESFSASFMTGLILAALALLIVALVSSISFAPDTAQQGLIRLSWRALGHEVEHCQPLSAQELARQPAHMRRTEKCSGRIDPYRLIVTIDGMRVLDTVIRAAGARGDRPVFVLYDLAVAPGERELDVQFRELEQGPHGRSRTAREFPEELHLHAPVQISERAVVLITYDPDARRLVTRSAQ